MSTDKQLQEMAGYIIQDEARRDGQGHLEIYDLPAGDGGGSQEVAGINDRYHPVEFEHLVRLIKGQRWHEAEAYARNVMLTYTGVVALWSSNLDPGVEYFLRDCAFNRGPTGAARVLQMALRVGVDGKVGPLTRGALATAQPDELIADLRKAREVYERRYAHRGESSKFWRGLVNRWDRVTRRAKELSHG